MKLKTLPLISVIIPAFNSQETIRRAVYSVLNQTYNAVELIVVNDCSTDKTPRILHQISQQSTRVKVFNLDKNRGVSFCRNKGLDEATGNWITFLDADDYFEITYLENIHFYLADNEFVCTSYMECRPTISDRKKNHTFGQNQNLTDSVLLKYMENYFLQPYKYTALVHCWNKFFLKELLDERKIKFDENLSQLEDVKFVSKYLRYTKKRAYIDQPGVFHKVDKLGKSLSTISGLEDESLQKLFAALTPIMLLKKQLLTTCDKTEQVSFQHFLCSMIILFCIRMSRQFRRLKGISELVTIYRWLSHEKTKALAINFRLVDGESKLLAISFRHFSPLISTLAFLLIRR